MSTRKTIIKTVSVFVMAGTVTGPSFAQAPSPIPIAATPLSIHTLTGSPAYSPRLAGNYVTYVTFDSANVSQIHYYNLLTGADAAVPQVAGISQSFSYDTDGTSIVFADRNAFTSLWRFDITTGAPPTQIATATGLGRDGISIGGATLAWTEFNPATGTQVIAYDLASATRAQVSSGDQGKFGAAASPDGQIVVWFECSGFRLCDVAKAVKTATGWTPVAMLTNTQSLTSLQATDTLAVYSLAATGGGSLSGNDVYWQPIAGGVESHLSLPDEQYVIDVSGSIAALQTGVRFTAGGSDVLALDLRSGALFQVTATPGTSETSPSVLVMPNGSIRVAYETFDGTTADVQIVEFQEAPAQLTGLSALVQNLGLPQGTTNSLDAKLQNALNAAQSGTPGAGCAALNAFINEVNAQTQTANNPNKKITPAEASQLIAAAMLIKNTLGCP